MHHQKSAIIFSLFIASTSNAFSEPEVITDDKGNIIMVIQDNGDVIQYTYNENGDRIVNKSFDEKIEFDTNGDTYNK
jgi:YD repeat-containing protein